MRGLLLALLVAAAALVVLVAGEAGGAPARQARQTVPLFAAARASEFSQEQAAPGAITEVPDPTGAPRRVLRLTVHNDDNFPVTATGDPRAQLQSPASVHAGDEIWWRSEFLLPKGSPSYVPGWVTVLEGPYGPPYDGTPPWHLEVNGPYLQWSRNRTYGWDVPWRIPMPRGSWVKVLVHMRFGHEGFVEMWIDGERVRFFSLPHEYNPHGIEPTERLHMATQDESNDGGPNSVYVLNYRKHGIFNVGTVYQGPMALGPTRASVEGSGGG
jgi:hypothetical protein